MENTLREYLANNYQKQNNEYDHERLAWAIQEYYSCHGMEWTSDDEAVIEEYGEIPDDFVGFDDDQLCRIDEVYDSVWQLVDKFTTFPTGMLHGDTEFTSSIVHELADVIADFLTEKKISVYFPTHVSVDNVNYIIDEYE